MLQEVRCQCILRPVLLHVYRDFCKNIYDWHFPLAQNMKQLCECIESFCLNDFVSNMNAHHKELESLEKGNACNAIFEFIDSNSSKRKLNYECNY